MGDVAARIAAYAREHLAGVDVVSVGPLDGSMLGTVADEPHTHLRYFCSPQHTESAFYPIISQLERTAGLAREDSTRTKLNKLDAVLGQTSASSQDTAVFAEMLSLPNDGRYLPLEIDDTARSHANAP
jgi:predicted ATPase